MFGFASISISLARQFLLASFLILLAGMVVIGLWVGRQIETGVVNRTAGVTALYVDSFISPHLQGLANKDRLDKDNFQALDSLLSNTPLGKRVVALKIWNRDGRVLYSNNPILTGRQFPISPSMARAFSGEVTSAISDLRSEENEFERQRWPRLIETYAPVRALNTESILAVAEFYQTTDELMREVLAARWQSWLIVGVATLAMYLLLAGLVGKASYTISAQQDELRRQVNQLEHLLAQNQKLHERVRRAAARVTALNEQFLRRISADLHDGPAQDLALALLRMESLAENYRRSQAAAGEEYAPSGDVERIQSALRSALAELRASSAGLRLPELESLTLAATVQRAVHDYEHKTGRAVALTLDGLPDSAPLPLKITLFRLLQESLTNGFRHAGAQDQRVEVGCVAGQLAVRISDNGQGFNPQEITGTGHLGLAGMRERVEILGGVFAVESAAGRGTAVLARLPLVVEEEPNE